jgi:hypothetical protein
LTQCGIFVKFFFVHPENFSVIAGIAVGANFRGAVTSATRKALQSGATKEEIARAVRLPKKIRSGLCRSGVLACRQR